MRLVTAFLLSFAAVAAFAQQQRATEPPHPQPGTLCDTGCPTTSITMTFVDSSGHCTIRVSYPCFPYACNKAAKTCNDKCSSDGQCAAGAKCNAAKSECVPQPSTCSDPFTIELATGQSVSCKPYMCNGGACQQQCSADTDCASGTRCANSHCVRPEGITKVKQ